MYPRCLNILILLTRLAASTVIVPATLVAGLMTFPTTCACGSDYPHEHPLFGIAGHRHDDRPTKSGSEDVEIIRLGIDGVTVQPAVDAGSPSLTAVHGALGQIQLLPQATTLVEPGLIPDGTTSLPDFPPPRV